jgi:Flp pilus assembly pilin Flp
MRNVGILILWINTYLRPRVSVSESGASLVEYALLLLFIVVVAMVALVFVGGATANQINNSGSQMFGGN